jgi:exopolysaccharide biosynthesis polyprenyl glycosylphosphotransferase
LNAETFAVLAFVVIFPVYLVLVGYALSLYHLVQSKTFLNEQRLALQTCCFATLMLCGTCFLTKAIYTSRSVVALTALDTALLMMSVRAISRRFRESRFVSGVETRNALIIGQGKAGQALRNHLLALPHLGFRFKGFVTLSSGDGALENEEVVGGIKDCVNLARSLFVDEIYFASPVDKAIIIGVVEEAKRHGIAVRVVPDLFEGLAWNARVEYVGQFPTILLNHGVLPKGALAMKRVIDLILSCLALVFVLPFFLVIAIIVRLDSKGPIFYKSERRGRKGRKFSCIKFRTMVENAEGLRSSLSHLNERQDILFKISNDPRITRSGRWLRKYSFDELPQLFNVLLGDMSLVGPRPPIASEVEKYHLDHLKRLEVLPGITGLWQVEAREDPSFDSYVSLDTAYVDNWNLMLDMRILARTLGVVVRGTGC